MALGDDLGEDEYVVGGDPDEAADPKPPRGKFTLTEQDEDLPNLVELLRSTDDGTERLKKLRDQVLDDFESAWESTEGYRAKAAENQLLFTGDLPLKQRPFEDAANVHIPMMLENLSRIVFRVAGELFGDWTNVFTVQPVGPDDIEKAMVLTKHGNWQIRNQLTDFYRQQMRGVLAFFTQGDVITHSWWNEARKRNCHDVLTQDDFAIPFMHVTVEPDMSDVPFKVKVMNLYRHDLQQCIDTWVDVDKVIKRKPSDLDDEPESYFRDAQAQASKVEKPSDQRATPYKVLWYEGWTEHLSLDGERDRYVQVIVDYQSRTPMCVRIHELPNWQEKLRFEREQSELMQHQGALVQHEQGRMQRQQMLMDARFEQAQLTIADTPPDPVQVAQVEHSLSDEANPPPTPPAWVLQAQQDAGEEQLDINTLQPKKPRKEPINTFAHAVCIEPMLGNLGIGYGTIQADLNRAGNILLSQGIDQGSLGNSRPMIVTGQLAEALDRPFKVGPAAINIAKGVSPATLKDSVMQLELGQANPQLFEVISMVMGWAQSSASAQEVLSGAPGKSGESAKGLNMRIEQANMQLSVPTRTYAETCLGQVLKNNALLNSMFLPDEEVISVNNEYRGPEQITVGRQMYERDYRVTYGSDLRFAGRAQRVAEADEVTAMVSGFPQMQQNNFFLWQALKNSLRARGMEQMIPYLGPDPGLPQTPFGIPPAPPPGMVPPGGASQGPPPAGPPAQ